jgi:Mg2+ and Co2+ transporter CorA
MPYLHYETDQRRQKMSEAINEVCQRRTPPEHASRDYMLIHAYLNSTPRLHPRRTLDQFFYHGIDTSERDQDQVVYRYLKRHHAEKKVYMVDQLWLWVLGKDLVVTCFPQRWDQPKQDALNVLEGIIEETNAKTRLPVQSVFDLAMLVTSRCSGMFDRHRLDDQEYQFLDMFESSIGHVTNRESQLFFRFNRASAQSAEWLQQHRRFLRGPAILKPRARSSSPSEDVGKVKDHEVPEELLDINVETSLLAEIKDIRDELNILAVVLENQTLILAEFEGHMIDELRSVAAQLTSASSAASDAGSTVIHQANLSAASLAAMSGMPSASTTRKTTEALISDIRRRAKEQRRLLDVHIRDIVRMDRQAESIYTSLTHLLDLKQKHSNALEARFARDHAVIAARQGQTVLVFTIVTIVFLPMSFVAGVFAINVQDWAPTADGGGLTFGYVAKYIFGVGLSVSLPLIAMAFTVGDLADLRRRAMAGLGAWWGRSRAKRKGAIQKLYSRSRSRGRRDSNAITTSKAEDDASSDTAAPGLHLGDEKPPAPARISAGGRISLGDEALPSRRSLGRNGSGGEGLSPILRPPGAVLEEIEGGGYDASRLGVIPQRPRGYSVTSGRSIVFSRPSFDRASRGSRGIGRGSDDLESGGGL